MTQRHYGEEEVEALLTVAMVLAEVVSSLDLEGVAPPEKARHEGPLTIVAQLWSKALQSAMPSCTSRA